MSTLDVVVPCYKYGQFLRRCVRSILDQEGVDLRVLVIDDASPDDTPEVAARLAAEDPRVEVRRHPVNRGNIATYNEGLLEWAKADYSLLISADDMLTPGALRRAVDLLDEYPNVGFVYGNAILTGHPETEPAPGSQDPGRQVLRGADFVEEVCRIGLNPIWTPTVVVRTRVQHEVGGYLQHLPHAGDLELWLRIARRADVGRLAANQAFYRVHDKSMTTAYIGLADAKQRLAAFDTALAQDGRADRDWEQFRTLAHRSQAQLLVQLARTCFSRGDAGASRQCTDLAAEIWPPIRSSRLFIKLRYKHLVGPRAWTLLQPMVRGMRRLTSLA